MEPWFYCRDPLHGHTNSSEKRATMLPLLSQIGGSNFKSLQLHPYVSCDHTHKFLCAGGGSTCCEGTHRLYTCCPGNYGVCCQGDSTCCPEGLTCSQGGQACLNSMTGIEMRAVVRSPSLNLPNFFCPDNKTVCASGETCCLTSMDEYGCCKYSDAVCCSDMKHCCPQFMVCDLTEGTCVNKTLSPPPTPPP